MFIWADAEKEKPLNSVWCQYHQMPENRYLWILFDVNIIRCRKTVITKFSLMLISSDAVKRDIEFCLMLKYDQMQKKKIEFYLLKFCLMLISSGADKPELLKFLWCLYEQMQKNRYYWIFSDVSIITCRKTGIIELRLMLISSDAVKRDIMEFSLMLLPSDAANRGHWIFSDVYIIRCRKTDIFEFCLMLISSDAEKQIPVQLVWC